MRQHTPVLLHEVITFLEPKPGKKYIDATVGTAGHTTALIEKGAIVLGIDQDNSVILRYPDLSSVALAKGERSRDNLKVVAGNFANLKAIAEEHNFTDVDGILFDLGLGSHQLDDPERGFSFQNTGPLDMRFDQGQEKTAGQILNFYSEKELSRIFLRYGEERRFTRRIVRAILEHRKRSELQTTTELFELIKHALPGKLRFKAGDTARKIFQALRIEVNEELQSLEMGLKQAVDLLKKGGGRLAVISFHSLEDRIVKQYFVNESRACVCPPSFPICVCSAKARLRILTKKPVAANEEEINTNPRAHSAKLRVAERI